jgi:hypothetical protein
MFENSRRKLFMHSFFRFDQKEIDIFTTNAAIPALCLIAISIT